MHQKWWTSENQLQKNAPGFYSGREFHIVKN